jgi:hypothetical protein
VTQPATFLFLIDLILNLNSQQPIIPHFFTSLIQNSFHFSVNPIFSPSVLTVLLPMIYSSVLFLVSLPLIFLFFDLFPMQFIFSLPPPVHLSRLGHKMWESEFFIGSPPQRLSIEMDSGWNQLVLSTLASLPPYPYPSVPFDPSSSSTLVTLTCSSARLEGIVCDRCDLLTDECITIHNNFSLFDDFQCRWGCDFIQFDGFQAMKFCFAMAKQINFTGDFGFKLGLNHQNQNSNSPRTSELLPMMKSQGLISDLVWSSCVNDSSGSGILQFGGLLNSSEVLTEGPMIWMSHRVIGCRIGDFQVFKALNGELTKAGVDLGTLILRIPSEWTVLISDYLISRCEQYPLVGMCDTLKYPLINNSTIMSGSTCYRLTEEQINEYPTLELFIESLDPSQPPHILSHSPSHYLFHSELLFDNLPGLVNCQYSDSLMADFSMIPEENNEEHVILGESFYRNWAVANSYSLPGQALAPIIQCGTGH